jgi:hypothetical protein
LSMIKESPRNALERYFGKLGQSIHMSQQPSARRGKN